MKGLLLKDYYLIRDGMVILLLTFVAVGAGLAFLTSPWVLIVVAGATMSFQGAMTVQSDRSSQWDRFSAVAAAAPEHGGFGKIRAVPAPVRAGHGAGACGGSGRGGAGPRARPGGSSTCTPARP